MAISAAILTAGCADSSRMSQADAAACLQLAGTLSAQEDVFINRIKGIRRQHISVQDYDRQMIAVLTERRAALQSTKLTEMSVSESLAGCSGAPLDDIRRKAQQEMVNLRAYLNDFNRALPADPRDVFIDQY